MVEVKLGLRTVDVPYTVRLYGVTEEMFDEMVDEDTKAELIDGVMTVHSPASLQHDDISGFCRPLMRCYAEEKKLGKVLGPDALFRPRRGRRFGPDLFFLERSRIPSPLPRVYQGVPDLVMELLSPSNRDQDLELKRPAYRQAGVREIWLVDAENREVIVDYRRGRRYVTKTHTSGPVHSTVLAGFWLDADWLWADPLPEVMACLRAILADQP